MFKEMTLKFSNDSDIEKVTQWEKWQQQTIYQNEHDYPNTDGQLNLFTPLGQNICILFYFQAFCKFLGSSSKMGFLAHVALNDPTLGKRVHSMTPPSKQLKENLPSS